MTRNAEQTAPSTVVWVDEDHAIVASTSADGGIETEQVDRGATSETEFLAHVVHEIGTRPTVSVVGPSSIRLALEREFVAINHRPERLVGIPTSARMAETEILARMRRLAA
jgi:hypothetical protein